MGRYDYQSDNDNDYTESLLERNEDVSEATADDKFEHQREVRFLTNQLKQTGLADNIRESEFLK